MALFFRDDKSYDTSRRMKGFDRYRQLMGTYAPRWILTNILTLVGTIPLAFGIWYSIMSSSVLVLIPASILGGMILGPFLAGMYDQILRGLRDAPGKWKKQYARSWKQNWKASLLPGAILGFLIGMLSFAIYILWISPAGPTAGTKVILLASSGLLLLVCTLYWPQLVLFEQTNLIRMKNAMLFSIQHFFKMLLVVAVQLLYIAGAVLFAPWTILISPILGYWFILFITQFWIYEDMDRAFAIEEQFYALEGDPWAQAAWEQEEDEK